MNARERGQKKKKTPVLLKIYSYQNKLDLIVEPGVYQHEHGSKLAFLVSKGMFNISQHKYLQYQ
jgi:hypothetical protein